MPSTRSIQCLLIFTCVLGVGEHITSAYGITFICESNQLIMNEDRPHLDACLNLSAILPTTLLTKLLYLLLPSTNLCERSTRALLQAGLSLVGSSGTIPSLFGTSLNTSYEFRHREL